MDLLDFSFDLDDDVKEEKPKNKEDEPKPGIKITHRKGKRHLSRKASSEHALEIAMDWYFQEGDCYHCFSFGDVDSMSFFKHILRQQKVEYLCISTLCMAGEDIEDLQRWYRRGYLGRVDFYVGEIFQGSYPEVNAMAQEFIQECGGRLVVFRNHSKVMCVKGERFDALIESSANVNTNPRSENTVVTIDRELVRDYIKIFGEIIPFNKDYGAEPYRLEE